MIINGTSQNKTIDSATSIAVSISTSTSSTENNDTSEAVKNYQLNNVQL